MNTPARRRTTTILLALAGIMLLAAGAAAYAQGAPIPPPAMWFTSTAVWALVTSGITATIRANIYDAKGPAAIALTFAVAIGGSMIASTGVLAFAGINLPAPPIEALGFGIIAGTLAMGWWDGATGVLAKAAEALSKTGALNPAAQPLGLAASAGPGVIAEHASPAALTDFILEALQGRFGKAIPPMAFAVAETLAREFAGRALNDDTRAAIQRRMLDLLAASGAKGRDL